MTDLEASITEVTVYADRALVTRRGSIPLDAGEHELHVNNLPQFLSDSLRASGQGPQGTRILNVDVTTAFYSRPPEAEIQTLQHELEQLQLQRQLLLARQNSLNDRRQWLRALGEQSKDFAKGIAQGQMKPNDCADFFRFMSTQSLEDAEAAQNLEVELKQLYQKIEAKNREEAQKQGNANPDRQAALITVSLAEAGEFELELSYLVMGASWHPQYDVRVQMNEDGAKGEVEVTYLGIVQQSTGERWENVGLSLSTARPSLAAVLPELDPWYLKVYTPAPMSVAAYASAAPAPKKVQSRAMPLGQAATGSFDTLTADDDGLLLDALEKEAPGPVTADVATATVEHTGTSLVFRVGRSVDIPSDNSPHKTTIARDGLPCEFDYVSAPTLEEHAHLRATISNVTERVLLAGDANIFLSGEYVGTTQVKKTAPTEQFKIFLGIDDSLKIKRELTERAVDKGSLLQSDLRRITYAYRIIVHNYAAFPRKVVIRDHLPVPQHERIKVKVQNIQPPPKERTKLELMTWNMTLSPDTEQKIEYRFTAEHPQGLQVIGLP